MEKNVKISILLDIYGNLLTEKQYSLLDDYYNSDLSLSEIAENQNITRQAVRDNLKKGENNLLEYEEKLGIMEKNLKQEEKFNLLLENLKNVKSKISDKEVLKLLKEIEEILNQRIKVGNI